MQPNKKYIASDGYEYFMCPMTEFKVTQVENVGTHLGTKSVDFASGTPGYRAPYYAPAKVKCVRSTPSSGEATWQTVNKVHCPNGYFGVVTFETVHDDTYNAYVGMVVNQGVQLGNMGAKGNATGVHVHLQFAQTADYSFFKNGYGIYMFNSESYVDDTFYVDDTNIIDGKAGNWRKTGSSSVNSQKYVVEEEHYAVRFTYDQIRIRKGSPDGEVVGYVNAGDEIEYFAKTVYNGHRWVRDKNNYWYAISNSEERGKDMWCELIDPSEMKANQQPTPDPEPEQPAEEPEKPEDDEWDLEDPDLEPVLLESDHGLTVHTALVDKSKYKYKCPYVMNPEYVTVHNAGSDGNPGAEQLNKSMGSTDEQKSWHLSVDDNGAWQGIALNRNAWHAGDGAKGNGNRKSIAIEICCDMYDSDGDGSYNDKSGSVDPRWEKARDNGALAAATLLDKYGWDISHLKKHQDWLMTNGSYKYCPHHILNDGWDDFEDLVQSKLDSIQGKPATPDKGEEGESIDGGLVNKLVKLLIKLIQKLLNIFK